MDVPEKLPVPDFSAIRSNRSRKDFIEKSKNEISSIDREIEEIERRIRILER